MSKKSLLNFLLWETFSITRYLLVNQLTIQNLIIACYDCIYLQAIFSFCYFPIIFFRWSSPQTLNSLTTFCKVIPCWVMEYSTVGGNVSYTVRVMSLFISKSFSSLESALSVMLPTSFESSLNRFFPKDKATIIKTFHLPFNTSTASFTASMCFMHSAFVSFSIIFFAIPFTLLFAYTIQMDSTIIYIANVNNFVLQNKK